MSGPLIILVGIIYAVIAAMHVANGDRAIAIVFAGYAFSNIGLWMGAE